MKRAKRQSRRICERSAWSHINLTSCRRGGVKLAFRGATHRMNLSASLHDFVSIFYLQCLWFAEATVFLEALSFIKRSNSYTMSRYSKFTNFHSDVHHAILLPLYLSGRLPTTIDAFSKPQHSFWANTSFSSSLFEVGEWRQLLWYYSTEMRKSYLWYSKICSNTWKGHWWLSRVRYETGF